MPRPRLPEGERKEPLTIQIKAKYIEQLRQIKGYNQIVENLIKDYLKKQKND